MPTISALSQTLARGNPDVLGLLVVDGDGRVQASDGASQEIVRAAVAITVPLRELLDRAAAELGCGDLHAAVIEGRDASIAIADVDGFRSVVVLGATGAATGALRADSLWVAERLRREGATS